MANQETDKQVDVDVKMPPIGEAVGEAALVSTGSEGASAPGEHALLKSLRIARDGSPRQQFIAGGLLPLHALRLLLANLKLVPLLIIPVLINMVLFAVSIYFLVQYAGQGVEWLWAKPTAGGALEQAVLVLWYVVYVLAILVSVALSYVIVLMLGGILASPFHDILSEATEKILLGTDEVEGTGLSFLVETLRSLGSNIVIVLIYFSLLIPVLMLNLIPGLGTVAASALGMMLSAYFVGLEYCDPLLTRRNTPVKRKFGLIREHIWFAGAFGLGTNFLLLLPFLNFLCMPIAVMGGTAMGIVLLEGEEGAEPAQ